MTRSLDTTVADVIASSSTFGEVLKMLPGIDVTDDQLRLAALTKAPEQKIGEKLMEMRVITIDQHRRALHVHNRLRAAKSVEEVMDILATVKRALSDQRVQLAFAIPRTNAGDNR